jgi:hypothetical protein
MISGDTIVCFSGASKGITHGQQAPVIPDHDWREMGTVILQLLLDPDWQNDWRKDARDRYQQLGFGGIKQEGKEIHESL